MNTTVSLASSGLEEEMKRKREDKKKERQAK